MSAARVLIAGIGNIFLGDDAFGVVLAQRLQQESLPEGVDVVDFGIRGMDLAFALERYDAAILLDAVARGGAPGTVYVLEPETSAVETVPAPHGMTPDRVLAWIDPASMPRTIRIVGCEPAAFGAEGLGQDGLSGVVSAAVEDALAIVEALARELADGGEAGA